MLLTGNRNRVVEHVRDKAGNILPRMPIQKNEEKRYSEPMKSEVVYEEESEHLASREHR
jgi:hypothetical protein